jgi:uncharacterized membrane protein YphA (DoxX/SURF4 family)
LPREAVARTPFESMRNSLLALVALAVLRIVVGLHFFLEGVNHLRDPEWSSAGFRKAAVGPLADRFRATLPQTGDWSGTLGRAGRQSTAEAITAWEASVARAWRQRLGEREQAVPLDAESRATAEAALEAAGKELSAWVNGLRTDLEEYRLEVFRLADNAAKPAAAEVPFERERVAKKRRELDRQAAGWMADAAAIGRQLEVAWDEGLPAASRRRVADATQPESLWKADRFVSWSLVTIGACLVVGLLTKFNAVGGICFLASVVASQPFWVTGAQATYNQWVEIAALFVIAALPTGGWSGLDYFLKSWCPLRGCCTSAPHSTSTPHSAPR